MISRIDPTLSLKKLQTTLEGQFFDRKSARLAPKEFAHQLSAFANASGGMVALGIENEGRLQVLPKNRRIYFGKPPMIFCKLFPVLS